MANKKLTQAKRAKNDEFYTQYADIEKEMNSYLEYDPNVFLDKTILLPCDDPEWSNYTKYFAQNFERFGIKKLISTSYASSSKPQGIPYQPSLLEQSDENYDEEKTIVNGKIFTLSRDKSTKVNINNLKWEYLDGNGDFRSDEVKELRDEADIIITNPPFSLFREFLSWIITAKNKKAFAIIGNINAITYKEIFPYIKSNEIWIGATSFNTGLYFNVPDNFEYASSYKFEKEQNGNKVSRVAGVCWFSNIDHGNRHEPIPLMTKEDNLKYNKQIKNHEYSYKTYENYNAIEIPFASGIPSGFDGVMGVPISFLNKYSPEQFNIVGMCENEDLYSLKTRIYSSEEKRRAYLEKFSKSGSYDLNASGVIKSKDNLLEKVYQRVLIMNRDI